MTSTSTIETDVVVIGSGVAGAMAAYKLAKGGANVVILEAGPRIERADIVRKFTETHHFDFSSGFPNEKWAPRPDWQDPAYKYYEATGPHAGEMEYLRVVGGTTWHWSGGSSRLLPKDFRLKSTYGVGRDWPISYDDLEPYYGEAEKEIGVSGSSHDNAIAPGNGRRSTPHPMPAMPPSYSDKVISEGLKKIGLNFITSNSARNSEPYDGRPQCMGFGTCSPICPSGAQYAAIVHIEKSEKLGVRVLENARADKIVSAPDGKITAVHAGRSDGTEVVVKAKIFVVAANGMESPRLFLMSANENRPKGIGNSSGTVGRNFYEHPGIVCRLLMPKPVYPRGPEVTMVCTDFRDGDFRKERSGWGLSFHNFSAIPLLASEAVNEGHVPPALGKLLRHRAIRHIDVNTQMEQLAREENGITLDWSKKDSAGQPVMKLHYGISDYEQRSFDYATEKLKRISKALDAEIVSFSNPLLHHHPMGMLSMVTDKKTSVRDGEGRSHDHPNLFALGGAAFPTAGSGGPTLSIAALSLRAGDSILKQLKG